MPFYDDLSPHEHGPDAGDAVAFNVGWLARGHAFQVGDLPLEFGDRLARLALRHPVNRMRGWQACPFCEGEYPIEVDLDGERQPVGDAAIYVAAAEGRVYAAPTLIVHYVTTHGYRPPDEFVTAVLADPRAAS